MIDEPIIRIGDLEFYVHGGDASNAGITSELLAAKLGYSHRKRLEELAERHAKYLAEFGQVLTVSIWVQAPGQVAGRAVEMPIYNREQATYLIAKSEKDVANGLTVGVVKGFIALQRLLSGGDQLAGVTFLNNRVAKLESLVLQLAECDGVHAKPSSIRAIKAEKSVCAKLMVKNGLAKSSHQAHKDIHIAIEDHTGWRGKFEEMPLGVVPAAERCLRLLRIKLERVDAKNYPDPADVKRRQETLFGGN